jgi:hypothetical protein
LAALFSKTKKMEDRRPDYFHYYAQTNMALHGEFDENSKHGTRMIAIACERSPTMRGAGGRGRTTSG